MNIDKLKLYKDSHIKVTSDITLHIPTLEEIVDYGEQKYFTTISSITSVGADLKWQLADIGIDYTEIDDYVLFYQFIAPSLSHESTKLFLPDYVDFSKMRAFKNTETEEVFLELTILEENNNQSTKKFLDKFKKKNLV